VKACYGFLVDNYHEHDEIFIFGFSRGAFVARSLSGMIGTVGIMRKHEMERFDDAWNWYWQDKTERDPCVIEKLAPDRHREVDVECIGVWDTVGALGIPGSRFCAKEFQFHETELGRHVRHAFQALAIDERRGNFQGAIWVPFDPDRGPPMQRCPHKPPPSIKFEGPLQVLRQVWFPGVHSNIGGGYPDHGLSDTAFLWMVGQLKDHRLLAFNDRCLDGALATEEAEAYPTGLMANSRAGFWRLIGSPVPRPVCVVSETERVHQSAWDRHASTSEYVGRRDLYRRDKRSQWLTAMEGLKCERTSSEEETATNAARTAETREKARLVVNVPRKLDWCSWLMGLVNPR